MRLQAKTHVIALAGVGFTFNPLNGKLYECGSITKIEFLFNVGSVSLNSASTDAETIGDVFCRYPFTNEGQNLQLTIG
jgi:hypothetical protein